MKAKLNFVQLMLAVVFMALAAFAAPARAAAVDVAAIVTDIGAQAVPIGLIGGAVLLIVVAVKAFKWVRSALS
ncbi:MAG: major capsid protein [Polaromonas sp.]|nr:major capsid protein [Polaromonas sp.]